MQYKMLNQVMFWFTQMMCYNVYILLLIRQANDVEENPGPTIFDIIDPMITVSADYSQGNEALFGENAVNRETPCKFCTSKQKKIEYDLAHQPTSAERNIIKQESEIFVSPEGSEERVHQVCSSHSSKRPLSKSRGIQQTLPKRDLATKYFGEHLFSLPASISGSHSALSTSKTQAARRKR